MHLNERGINLNRPLTVSRAEQALLAIFVILSALDAFLTVQLVRNGFLSMELMPVKRSLFTVFGPPNYSYWVFISAKGALTVAGVFALLRLVRVSPRLRKAVFLTPACILGVVCVFNLAGLLS